jgi:hypothetical protein
MKRTLVLVLVLGCAACGERPPTAPEAFGRVPCRPPSALVAMVVGTPFVPAAMHSALIHAAGPMSVPLGVASDVVDMQDAIRIVAADVSANNYDGACRLLAIAAVKLEGLPPLAATYADRDGIRLILALTAQALANAMPK